MMLTWGNHTVTITATLPDKRAYQRPIDLTIDQQANQTLVSEDRREREFSLRAIEPSAGFAERLAMNARHIFIGRVAHGSVVTVEVKRAHWP